MRRWLAAVGAATALLWPQPAGAQQDHRDLFWALTASPFHVAHCTDGTIPAWNDNHTVCRIVWPDGSFTYVASMWTDPWCELTAEPGDTAGRPLAVRWRSNNPWGSCAPGAGVYLWVDERYASAMEGWVFPRDAGLPWARGTVVEVR